MKSVQVVAQTEDLNLIAVKKAARLASHGDVVEITAAKKYRCNQWMMKY